MTYTLTAEQRQKLIDFIESYEGVHPERSLVTILRTLPEVSGESVGIRHSFDGYGWMYIDNGQGSGWRGGIDKPDAEFIYAAPQPAADVVKKQSVPEHIALLMEAYDFAQFNNIEHLNQLPTSVFNALHKLLADTYRAVYAPPPPPAADGPEFWIAVCEGLDELRKQKEVLEEFEQLKSERDAARSLAGGYANENLRLKAERDAAQGNSK